MLKARPSRKAGAAALASRLQAAEAWGHIAGALASSTDPKDRSLAGAIVRFVQDVSPERTERADRPVRQPEAPALQVRSGPKNDRLLNPENPATTLQTLVKAAGAVGKRVKISLVNS